MKLNDLVTLERGHLSWFRYPTHNIGTYLRRGVSVVINERLNILSLCITILEEMLAIFFAIFPYFHVETICEVSLLLFLNTISVDTNKYYTLALNKYIAILLTSQAILIRWQEEKLFLSKISKPSWVP